MKEGLETGSWGYCRAVVGHSHHYDVWRVEWSAPQDGVGVGMCTYCW
jgi:hypothetical protein